MADSQLTKKCPRCGEEKSPDCFGRNGDRLASHCLKCRCDKQKKYREDNPDKINQMARDYARTHRAIRNAIQRRYEEKHPNRKKSPHKKLTPDQHKAKHLRRRYGMSLVDYERMLFSQDFRCAICRTPKTYQGKKMSVDHCHKSGSVRGLLCGNCNNVLGFADDNQKILRAAIKYLKKYQPEPISSQ